MKLISQITSENLPYSFTVTSKILLSLLTAVTNECILTLSMSGPLLFKDARRS